MHTECKPRCSGWVVKIVVLVIAGIALLSLAVMLLWNWLFPAIIDGVHPISYLQAVGILVLSKILFRGFPHGRWHRHHRLHQLSPEEREKFKSSFGGCCGSSKGKDAAPADKAE